MMAGPPAEKNRSFMICFVAIKNQPPDIDDWTQYCYYYLKRTLAMCAHGSDGGHSSKRRMFMSVIILIVSLIGWKVSGYDFTTLYFYIELSYTLQKAIRRYFNDKATTR